MSSQLRHRRRAASFALVLIDAYGLFWERDGVQWGGGQGRKRSLTGALARTSTSERVEFAAAKAIYALYTEAFDLLYIGQSGRGSGQALGKRLADHRTDHLSERWERFSWFRIGTEVDEKLSEKQILDPMEAVAISIAEPRLNRRGGNYGGARQYYQVVQD